MIGKKEVFKTYTLDYLGKYHFYEKEDFIKSREEGKFILDKIDESNRFDYKGESFKYTKFGNISAGLTERNVPITIKEDDINVIINDEKVHLNLIYKMDIKKLEDHYRVTTKISEKNGEISSLLYINLEEGENFIKALEHVKKLQENYSNK